MGDLPAQMAAGLAGLVILQLCGLINLSIGALLGRWSAPLPTLLLDYSIGPLPSQLGLCAAAAVLSVLLRWCLVIRE